jgi:hypothetical protein
MNENSKALERVWRQLREMLRAVFNRSDWHPFQLTDVFHEFHAKADTLRQAVGLAVGCSLSRGYHLSVEGSDAQERETLSRQVALLIAMEGVLTGDELQLLLQAEIEASADGLSCQKLLELLQSRAEGDQPLSFMYMELGDGLSSMSMASPDACTRIWLPHVRERGQAFAVAISTSMVTHQTECRRGYREQYAADGPSQGQASNAQSPLEREMALWMAEDPSRKQWPREMPKFQKPEDPNDFNAEYGKYEILVGQYEEFRLVLQTFQDRLEEKVEEDAPFVFPDEHRWLRALDAVRQIVGGGMGHWILTEEPYSNFVPRNPANPSLSKLGWKAVFRACTPPEYFHLFLDRPFESVSLQGLGRRSGQPLEGPGQTSTRQADQTEDPPGTEGPQGLEALLRDKRGSSSLD